MDSLKIIDGIIVLGLVLALFLFYFYAIYMSITSLFAAKWAAGAGWTLIVILLSGIGTTSNSK